MPKARINGIDLYYEKHGTGPAIVLTHGALSNRVGWWQQIPVLSRRYTCVTVDLRGFGESREVSNGPGMSAMPEDIAELIKHLEISQAAVVGQSLGGWVALEVAMRYPDRVSALILADSHARIADLEVAEIQRKRRDAGEVPTDLKLRALGPDFPKSHPELSFLFFQLEALNPPRPKDYFADYFGPGIAGADALSRLKCPVLFIVGEHDIGNPPPLVRLLARNIRGAQVREIPGAGHSAYFERAELFNRAVLDFLNRPDA